ncbi:M48 family metalloprotease [Pontivivens nitratireducens]|uniref:M48 family metalloprotease n=1 Tax=Pontivivens nitratireducens TaxID=2758038 RepID=A0A6G7VL79_9RHOB|nr:M48 family metalloprotease [Pontibrevibacter nitratireducens]QIK40660.1 M48 family metalloprotease [Pontibrevibacter nitratireducens]
MALIIPILIAVLGGLVMMLVSTRVSARQLDAQSRPLTDPKLLHLTDRMARELGVGELQVFVQNIATINGLAAPDGRVFITRGFMEKYRAGQVQAEEIASVIAHELGHVALGHSQRRMIDYTGQNAIRMALMLMVGRVVPIVGPWLIGMLTQLLAARLSRRDEYEADAYAAALLTKIGVGIGPQRSLFRKLDHLAGGTNGTPAWLMSHPKAEERVAAIEALSRGWNTRPVMR